jgi:hypothetical protein
MPAAGRATLTETMRAAPLPDTAQCDQIATKMDTLNVREQLAAVRSSTGPADGNAAPRGAG